MSSDFYYLRLKDVQQLTSLSRSTIYLRAKNGTFPAPRKLGLRTSAWKSTDIQAWMEDPTGWTEKHTQDEANSGL